MRIEDIKRLEGKVVTDDEFIEIEEDENVLDVSYNGYSGLYYHKQWFTILLVDETEVDIYV